MVFVIVNRVFAQDEPIIGIRAHGDEGISHRCTSADRSWVARHLDHDHSTTCPFHCLLELRSGRLFGHRAVQAGKIQEEQRGPKEGQARPGHPCPHPFFRLCSQSQSFRPETLVRLSFCYDLIALVGCRMREPHCV